MSGLYEDIITTWAAEFDVPGGMLSAKSNRDKYRDHIYIQKSFA